MTEPTTSATPTQKRLAAALAFAAVAALAYASLSTHWAVASADDERVWFGLRSYEDCVGDTCRGGGLAYFTDLGASDAFPVLGWVCSVALWLGAAGLALGAGAMLAGRFLARPIAPTTVSFLAIAVALVSGVAFIAMKPSPIFGPSVGAYAFVGGAVAGIIASILVARIRPADPDWDDPRPFDEENW